MAFLLSMTRPSGSQDPSVGCKVAQRLQPGALSTDVGEQGGGGGTRHRVATFLQLSLSKPRLRRSCNLQGCPGNLSQETQDHVWSRTEHRVVGKAFAAMV